MAQLCQTCAIPAPHESRASKNKSGDLLMIAQLSGNILIASCIGAQSYFGGTQATLIRDDDAYTYRLVYESVKGPDGDGEAKVIADETESVVAAVHMEDSMLYQFPGWELEIYKVFTGDDKSKLDAVIRKHKSSGEAETVETMTCSFHD
jgi:hypothetical protein